jgi:hypothetical protein
MSSHPGSDGAMSKCDSGKIVQVGREDKEGWHRQEGVALGHRSNCSAMALTGTTGRDAGPREADRDQRESWKGVKRSLGSWRKGGSARLRKDQRFLDVSPGESALVRILTTDEGHKNSGKVRESDPCRSLMPRS